MQVALSLLDRSRTRDGQADAAALRQTVHRAELAEAAGYRRFWVAEHHAVPGIASGVPAVLIGAIAHRTSRIRVGSGGVMLPNHQPIVVAEQFAMLEAMHPGRIDLGVGRSLGFTAPVRDALRTHKADADDFAADIEELRGYLHGTAEVTVRPRISDPPPIFVLGTGQGMRLAARLGLSVVVAGPLLRQGSEPFDRYRADFRPGTPDAGPYVIVGLDILIADTEAEARELQLPEAWAMAVSRETGTFPPLSPVDEIRRQPMTERRRRIVDETAKDSLAGTEDQVAEGLEKLIASTGADEVLSSASTFDTADLHDSDARLARIVGLG
ncbi:MULTISPECIES: MsnO8 family LLM class oxidoreductase [Rhodococcus]|uniref:MsnO8 family LLM class oxidoreductase n=1 Tax=Rhodococcus TaxID=1827 RepID=UPI0010203435|nr:MULTISPECIES: MsnO8 family LLM class oxidoreductase [Rhodococcus]UTT48264.1 MsnO8 family LLM class oxidoreductase [Rhodococcus gordoniae]